MSYDLTNYQLPSNWEQKYDGESKRFFFIDHAKKITTWIDPRIELYKKDHQQPTSEISPADDPLSAFRIPANTSRTSTMASNTREKEAKEIHKKFSEFSIAKITEMLEKNCNNVSLVESELSRERKSKIQKEETDKQKQKQTEESAKKLQEENDKRIKEEVENQVKEEYEKRLKEETDKQLREEFENRFKSESSTKQIAKVDKSKSKEENVKTDDMKVTKNLEFITDVSNDQERESNSAIYSDLSNENKSKLNRGPNKSLCNGPNRNNCIGPNEKLLIRNRENLAKGSDPANRSGSQSKAGIQISS